LVASFIDSDINLQCVAPYQTVENVILGKGIIANAQRDGKESIAMVGVERTYFDNTYELYTDIF
jgi:hypothetical protein